jgi:hypothetical protein
MILASTRHHIRDNKEAKTKNSKIRGDTLGRKCRLKLSQTVGVGDIPKMQDWTATLFVYK